MIKNDMRDTVFFIRIVKSYELDYTDMNPLHYRDGADLVSTSSEIQLSEVKNFADVIIERTKIKERDMIYKIIDLSDIDKTIGEITNIKEIFGFEISGQKSKFFTNDIIFGKLRPYLNNVAMVYGFGDSSMFIGSTEWVRIKPKFEYPFYLFFALRSNYVLSQTLTTKGSIRPRLKENEIPNLKIPKINKELMELINEIIKYIFEKRRKSNIIINHLIRFYDFLCKAPKIEENLILVVDNKKLNRERMDSEFYFYKKINSKLRKNGGAKLSDYIYFSDEKIDSYYSDGDSINYITIADINPNLGEIVSWREKIYSKRADRSVKAPNRAKMLLKINDILLPHLKGSLTSVAWVPSYMNNFIGTNGFSIVRSEKLRFPFIYIILRSKTIQDQLFLLASGTIMEDLSNEMIGDVSFYLPSKEINNKINKTCKIALEERWLARKSYHLVWKAYHDYCSVNVNKEMLIDKLNRILEELTKRKLIKIPVEFVKNK